MFYIFSYSNNSFICFEHSKNNNYASVCVESNAIHTGIGIFVLTSPSHSIFIQRIFFFRWLYNIVSCKTHRGQSILCCC